MRQLPQQKRANCHNGDGYLTMFDYYERLIFN